MSAHLVDEVIPRVKIRQWVIIFPHDLRYLLAWKKDLRSWVLSAVMRALERHYVRFGCAAGGCARLLGDFFTFRLWPESKGIPALPVAYSGTSFVLPPPRRE